MEFKFVMTTGNLDSVETLRKLNIEPVIAVKHHSYSALTAYTIEEIRQIGPVSVLLNRYYFEDDQNELNNLLRELENMELFSIYYADPAILQKSSDVLKKKLIYRPETLMTSISDIRWWMDRGIKSVSVSPLITSEEVMEIGKEIPEAELTIHGYLFMSVSRRPLLSAYNSFYRTDYQLKYNRSLRLKESTREDLMPVYENDLGMMVYSDFVQESFDSIVLFADTGYHRFFIDSVYSDEESVLEAIRCYRALLNGENVDVDAYKKKYSMKYSTGYYGQKTVK